MGEGRWMARAARLLRIYPRAHRESYGDEMLAVVRARWEGSGRSSGALVGIALELVWGAVLVWYDVTRRGTMGLGHGWALDIRFVVRSLWKSRGYVATAVLVLAGTVAANATVLSYVKGTLLAPAPYPEPESVMIVWGSSPADGQIRDVISGPNFIDIQDRATALDPVAALHGDEAYLMVDGRPEVVIEALEVSHAFFDVLRVEPYLGRLFDASDRMSGAAETAVVTYAFWHDDLGGDPDVVGSVLDLEGNSRTIVGVLPEGFEFIAPAPLFVPLRDDVLAAMERTNIHYHVIGRLAPGATVGDANRDLAPVMQHIATQEPGYGDWSFLVEPLHEVSVESVRPVIVILAVTVLLVLLVALVNLATLFRIRAMARGTELGVRSALGASKPSLVRVLMIETLGLSLTGAIVGLLLAPFLLAALAGMLPTWIPIPDSAVLLPVLVATLDPTVAAVTLVGAALGSLALTAPTFRRVLNGRGFRVSSRGVHGGLRGVRLLVMTELGVATMLCIAAGLTVRSTARLLSIDVGVEHEGVLTLYVGDVWGEGPAERTAYFRQVVEAVEAVPGVERAGVMGYVDFQAEDDFAGVYFLDRELQPRERVREEWRRVDEGLFEAVGMRIVRGRGFESADFDGTPRVAVVNEAFARKHYPDGAVGELLSTHNERYRELTVVGVSADVRSLGPAAPAPPMLYVPFQGDPRGTQGLHARVRGEPMGYASALREAVWSVDSSQPMTAAVPMSDLVASWVAIPRATRALVSSLAGLALLLSVLGVFGVVAYAVRTRRAEMGVRLALGATPTKLEVDQLCAIAPIVAVGVGGGVAMGLVGARTARALIFGVSPADPVSVVGAIVVMVGAAMLATYLPARRAGRVDVSAVIGA